MVSTVVLSAGGTGGHVFPAEALAKELKKKGYNITFVTDRRGNSFTDRFPDCKEVRVCAKGYAGKGKLSKITALIQIGTGILQCMWHFLFHRPKAVVGFGGYAAFPASFAAILMRIPLILHEQNSVLGGANRVLAPYASLIATSFQKVARIPEKIKTVRTGLPLRPALLELQKEPYPAMQPPFSLLIIGGSQGAKIFADVIPEALKQLPDDLKKNLNIAHQCRADDLKRVQKAYENSNLCVETASFFHDIPERLKKVHLVICRAGASSIAELEIAGRPAIIVPIYRSPDAHQLHNALAVTEINGAFLIEEPDFTPQKLSETISELFQDEKRLITASENIKKIALPEAAALLAQAVEETIIGKNNE